MGKDDGREPGGIRITARYLREEDADTFVQERRIRDERHHGTRQEGKEQPSEGCRRIEGGNMRIKSVHE